jgi:hypothetical protein
MLQQRYPNLLPTLAIQGYQHSLPNITLQKALNVAKIGPIDLIFLNGHAKGVYMVRGHKWNKKGWCPRISFELKSLNYDVIKIEFVNCLPTKFNGDILFELPPLHHLLGHSEQLQGMDKKYDGHTWCKL